MENRTILLNTQLTNASKKFYKSCEQIKIIKQHISDLMNMFSYCDQKINRLNREQVANSSQTVSISTSMPTVANDRRTDTFSTRDHTYSSTSALVNDDIEDFVNDEGTYDASTKKKHLSVLRESIRQQIENLQGVKTAYFMYAHRKADEITKLQCELYGEETVMAAYSSSPDLYSSHEDSVNENNHDDNLNQPIQDGNEASVSNWSSSNNQAIEYFTD